MLWFIICIALPYREPVRLATGSTIQSPTKLPRHFEDMHNDEPKVIQALALQKKLKERKAKWRELMNKGDFLWNTKAIKEGKGTLIPFKRPSTQDKYKTTDYLPCEHCFALFLKHEVWRHSKTCPGKTNTKQQTICLVNIALPFFLNMNYGGTQKPVLERQLLPRRKGLGIRQLEHHC